MSQTIAIVGRPNVGKSRLFNALLKKRLAIVHDQPGITRDSNTEDLVPGLTLVDTGGWGLRKIKDVPKETEELFNAVEAQVDLAIEAADMVLFVVDGRTGPSALDDQIAKKLRCHSEKVMLIINKIDRQDTVFDEGEFIKYGFPRWQVVSAEHDRGIEGLRNNLLKLAPADVPAPSKSERRPSIAILGRPNVGKSSLTNALLRKNRAIVSSVSGTTRDPVSVELDYVGKKGTYHFRLVDTAGLKARAKVSSPVEVFSQMRARDILRKADVAILVIDALDGVTSQDKALAGEIQKAGKPIIVVVNKWDLAAEQFKEGAKIEGYETLKDFETACRESVEGSLFFTALAPIIFLSAKESFNLEKLLQEAQNVESQQDKTLSTPEINKLLTRLLWKNSPRNATGKIFKVYYAAQTGSRPYYLRLFCNQAAGINDSFRRYLSRGFAEHFETPGCPYFFSFVSKPKREWAKENHLRGRRK